ncbi:MAG TPA: sigma-70 family RNA polymerase sigma factor [Solirubrobacteraceae bacterium]|jgi:RNA polymerase sigma factor (sigma-70 family)|nr:sigma-70 family RNA polymerase sigma factor [Solirubrobacteraceae bacterium]
MSLEPDEFTRLYRRYAQSLLLFFQRRVQDPEIAVDLMADTFTMAFDRREQFRGGSEDELSGWLWSIAQSILRAHERHGEAAERGARRLGRERRALADREIERIEELAGLDQLRDAVRRGVAQLPVDQREAVRLRVLKDLSYSEISEQLGVSVQAIRMRVSRALRQLADDLDRDLGRPRP